MITVLSREDDVLHDYIPFLSEGITPMGDNSGTDDRGYGLSMITLSLK